MALKDVARTAIEAVIPPNLAELHKRLEGARQALVQTQGASDKAQQAYDVALTADTPRDGQEAQAAVIQAKLALDRAAGRLQALERQLQTAEAAQAADAQTAGRKRLAHLKVEREQHGQGIVASLDALQAAAKAFLANEDAILALPESVRGRNASAGYNIGTGPLRTHVLFEIEKRVLGQTGGLQRPSLAEWLELGNRTLGS